MLSLIILCEQGFNNPPFWDGYGTRPDDDFSAQVRAEFYNLYEVQKYLSVVNYQFAVKDI